MAFYVKVNNLLREVKKPYLRVNGQWRKIKKLYYVVDNVARQFWPEKDSVIHAVFSGVAQNGSASATSTTLTLTFDKAIAGLTAADITLSGVTGLVKGTLSGSGPNYTLPISGFTAGGTLTVSVEKEGYEIENSYRTVEVFYLTPVTFNGVSANGSSSVTSTTLTLIFSKAVPGLSAADITLSDVTGIVKGTLSGSGPTYTLGISGFTEGGTLKVTVNKAGFEISIPSRNATVYYAVPVTFNSVTADGSSSTATSTMLTLTFDKAIAGLTANDVTLSGVTGLVKGTLSGSGPSYTLGISGFTAGGTLTVAVAKAGYAISNASRTVTVYVYTPITVTFNSVTADGSATVKTTALTLNFSAAILGLSADDITLSGITGITKGVLSGSGPSYTLPISGISSDGKLTVFVNSKIGYIISIPSRTVNIYRAALVQSAVGISFHSGKHDMAAASIGNYAIFAGGRSGYYEYGQESVEAYDSSLTQLPFHWDGLSCGRYYHAAASVGNYAIFGGGIKQAGSNYILPDTFDVYDSSLTHIILIESSSCLSLVKHYAASVGNYALFTQEYENSVDVYDSALTRSTATELNMPRYGMAAASVGNYALFGGGKLAREPYSTSAVVEAYDSALTRTTATALSAARMHLAACGSADYALFGGGDTYDKQDGAVVDAYDSALTRTTPSPLSVSRYNLAACRSAGYALFGGGFNNFSPHYYSEVVDAYDPSLTRTTATKLKKAASNMSAASVGNYILFAGGYQGGTSFRDVTAYSL
jgi:hypothetical protein